MYVCDILRFILVHRAVEMLGLLLAYLEEGTD